MHFASLVDLCHLKHAELAQHLQRYKVTVVLWEDNVKDDIGHGAVVTEHGESASQMTAEKNLDTLSSLLCLAG